MGKALLVAWGHEYVDEVVDALGDVEVDVVVGKPTVAQWRGAPLVLVDARVLTLAAGMPAHPRMVVVAPAKLDGDRLAAAYRGWAADYPDAPVYHLPHGTEAVRQLVADAAKGQAAEVRVGVVGGHGGAGATTLAVALALVAAEEGRRVLLVDAAGRGGVDDRLGTPADGLRVVDEPFRPLRAVERHPAEVKVVDLDRALDGGQIEVARQCDVVLLVANAQRNAMASRRVAATLSEQGVRWALVPTWMHDKPAQELAREFAVRFLAEVPLDPASVFEDGRVHLVNGCHLLELARELLRSAPYAAARVAA
ncbi:nucleotide-binding protein [Micromonospora chersina]|uniref:nucleotide-binding protein n=1 Tax=Micromonospora chersina TaxID=47854 RepID=UPI0037189010